MTYVSTHRSGRRVRPAAILAGLLMAAVLAVPAHAADAEGRAKAILDATGVQGGIVVHLGCGDGALTAALRASEAYVVQGLARDADTVAKARDTIRAGGLYGPVSVSRLDGNRLPYAPNLVNLVVADDLGGVPMDEVMRVLAPRGVAYVRAGDGWKTTVKPWPNDIDEWTHFLHGPDNNATARDRRVGPPQHLHWTNGPMWCRSHDGTPSSIGLVVSANGRLISVIDHGLIGQPGVPEQWTVVARDAFNGTHLWSKPLPRRMAQKALAAVGDRVFLTVGGADPILALDAATGEEVGTFDQAKGSDELIVIGNTVLAHLRGIRKTAGGGNDAILALDAATGRTRWQTPARNLLNQTLAAAGDRVCYHDRQEVICLDLATGKERWRAACDAGPKGGTLMIYEDTVVFEQGQLRVFDAKTGKPLWKGPHVNGRLRYYGSHGLIWVPQLLDHGRSFLWTPSAVEVKGYDVRTGDVKRTVTVSHLVTPGHHIRCYPAKATERYILLPKRGVEFVDLEGTNHMRHNWLRAPCRHGATPANGLLYAPPHQCFCYPGVKVNGFNAVAADLGIEGPEPEVKPQDRLVKGPAYAWAAQNVKPEAKGTHAWPMYRHDPRRSGRADCTVPADVKPLWQTDLGGRLTQPVVGNGRLLVAEENAHTIHAIDAASGKPVWRYTTEGRIDSPPTLVGGLALVGSHDGCVYCLRASDGALVWRFRAAPGTRRLAAFDQIESVWPVHGSVLVMNGVAYATAGRSSYLDGGIAVYALDAVTGKVLHETRLDSGRPDVTRDAGRPFDMEGTRSDLLVSDGTDFYLFFQRFGKDLEQKPAPRITKLGDRDVTLHLMSNAGFLDRSWFDRSYWTYSRRWPGYYFSYNGPKSGRILVFDDETTYGLHVFTTRQGHSPRFWPGTDGYELFADSNAAKPVLRPTAVGREKGSGYSRSRLPKWSVQVPIRAYGLVLAGDRLALAGTPDVVPNDDPYAALDGRRGARLWIVNAADGKRLAEYELDTVPVFDGLIAAGGRLYLATEDGRLVCMGQK